MRDYNLTAEIGEEERTRCDNYMNETYSLLLQRITGDKIIKETIIILVMNARILI